MYNNLLVTLQHSTEVVYFSIIIWYTFALSFTKMSIKERLIDAIILSIKINIEHSTN